MDYYKDMKTRYTILEAESVVELIDAVNAFIDENGEAWHPIGNVTSNPYGSKFFQAMCRDI